jgi:hypothetical protein
LGHRDMRTAEVIKMSLTCLYDALAAQAGSAFRIKRGNLR